MKINTIALVALLSSGFAHAGYSREQAEKAVQMLNFLSINARTAQASATILQTACDLSPQQNAILKTQIKIFTDNLSAYHAFLKDVQQNTPFKINEILENATL